MGRNQQHGRAAGASSARSQTRRATQISVLAIAVRSLAILAVFEIVGARSVDGPLTHLNTGWVAVVALAEACTYPSYFVAYRSVARLERNSSRNIAATMRLVIAGFGPLAFSSGFTIDRNALSGPDNVGRAGAVRTVGTMSTLEWAVLGPLTFVVSVVLLCDGSRVGHSWLWPTLLGVPVFILFTRWVTTAARVTRWSRPFGRRIDIVARWLEGLASLRVLVRCPRRFAGAWIGMFGYWLADIGAFWAAGHAAGLELGLGVAVLAYTSGYLVSRRSLPLGGAGLAELLLVYALHELGQPAGASLVCVMVYRLFNFLAGIAPALIAFGGMNRALEVPTQNSPPHRPQGG